MLRVTKNTNIIKPSMYKRVDEEKKRMRIGRIIANNTGFNLKRKYFNKLKFYHGIIQLRKRIKLSYKLWSFLILKNYYLQKREKYDDIIEHFDALRKIKVFALLYKEHVIQIKKNSLVRDCLVKNFELFINNTTKRLFIKYDTFKKKEKLYYNLFVRKVISQFQIDNNINNSKLRYEDNKRTKEYSSFIQHIKTLSFIKHNLFSLKSTFSYMNFLSTIRDQIAHNNNLCKKGFGLSLKQNYRQFIHNYEEIKRNKKENEIALLFYSENMKRKILSILKRRLFIREQFQILIQNKYIQSKEKVKNQIKEEKTKIKNLILKYRKYKKEKIIPYKQFLLDYLQFRITQRLENRIAIEHYRKITKKKVYLALTEHAIKMTNFKIFLVKFKKVHNQVLMNNYIQMMRYKTHKFLINEKMPDIVAYYLNNKFDEKLNEFAFKQMKFFFIKTKKIIFNKIMNQRKMMFADELYTKKTKIKVMDCFRRYITYLSIRNKHNKYLKQKVINLLLTLINNKQK